MATETLPQRTMASALASDLRVAIIQGELRPGAKLRIKELCERYDASAIPMREALSRLATGGFVVAEDQRGFRVADVSPDELLDITETRIHIECEALRRSIAHGGLDWEERLIGAHHRLQRLPMLVEGKPDLSPEWEQAHSAFHAALISGCGSHWLMNMAELLRDQTTRYRYLSVTGVTAGETGGGRDVAAEHTAMLRAALDHEAERAASLLAEHLRHTTRLVLAQGA